MNFDSIPEALQTKMRLSILLAIFNGEKDFNTLKEILQATDGNLSVQLTKLEQYGCLTSLKVTDGKKKRTVYSISEYGKRILVEYIELLNRSIANNGETVQ